MNPTRLGKYILIEQLGKGGFGTVYKATDPIGRTVAIKVLKPGWVDDPGVIARFRLEALAAGNLFHARIATILDFEEENEHPFLVMRYVDGRSLDKILDEKGKLDWNTAIRILKEVAEGLDFAHKHGFIHRDIKPANILISETEGAVLTDFGLVKAAQVSGLSSSEVLLGSPNYIAPEIWEGKKASPATDIYALACVFYEMITGKVLFAGDSSPQIMTRHVLEGPQFPITWPEKIPLYVESVLRKALMMEPGDRYPNALAFASALEELEYVPGVKDRPQSTLKLDTEKNRKRIRQPFVLWVALGFIILSILAVGIFLLKGSPRKQVVQIIPSLESLTLTLNRVISTPTSTHTLTPTETSLKPTRTVPGTTETMTPTSISPTNIPGSLLPVFEGTLIPLPGVQISVENAHQVVQLARFGKGTAGEITRSPISDEIVIAHTFGVYFFDPQNLQQKRFLAYPEGIQSLAYSTDGSKLAISRSDHAILILNAESGEELQTLTENKDDVRVVTFTQDGKRLISGSADGMIRVWQLSGGNPSMPLAGHQDSITDLAISPDGKILASASADATIKLWDIEAGSLLKTLTGHSNGINGVAFSPDGQYLASASNDHTVRLWSVSDRKELWQESLPDSVNSVAFSPKENILAIGVRDKTIQLRNIDDGKLIISKSGHRASVKQISFSRDGKTIASISEDGTMGLWLVENLELMRMIEVSTGLIRSVTFTTDNQYIAAGTRTGTVQLWNLTTAGVEYLPVHEGQVNTIFSLPDNILASGSDDKTVKLWPITGDPIHNFTESQSQIESLAVSPDGLLAAGGFDGSVLIWRTSDSAQPPTILKESVKPIWSVAFSPDYTLLAAASLDGWVRTWNTSNWLPSGLQFNLGEEISVFSLAFSPDGNMIAFSYSDPGIIRIYQVSGNNELVRSLEGHTGAVWGMCFTPDSQILVSGSLDGTIRLWNVFDGSLLLELRGHTNKISSVACSPNGKLIASGSWDGTVRLWGIAP